MKKATTMKKALRRTIRDMLIVVSLLCFIFGGTMLWNELQESSASDYEIPTLPAAEGETDPEGDSGRSGQGRVNFDRLRRDAPEVVAWITVPETQINYPVVQAKDNKYYLEHTVKRESSRYGAIFMDYRNHGDFSDFYTVIYGHNMRSGKMFGTLKYFRDKKFFDRVKYGTLQTPEKNYQLQFFAYAETLSSGEYYTNLAFFVPGEKEDFIEMVRKTAGHWRELPLGPEDQILALSTCYSATGDQRTILLAKMVEKG